MAHLNVAASQLFGTGRQIVVIDHTHVSSSRGMLSLLPSHFQHGNSSQNLATTHKLLCDVIDSLGQASAHAQGLPSVITSANKLMSSHDQRIYCLIEPSLDRVVGILKVGKKRLFLSDPRRTGSDHFNEAMIEVVPLSILDFYVVETAQRRGYGRRLCDAMLAAERIFIGHTAIDRPSPKMVSFLSRHYGLTKPFSQRNNFTVFDSFFHSSNPALARVSSGVRRDLRKSFSSDCIPGGGSAVNPGSYAETSEKARQQYHQSGFDGARHRGMSSGLQVDPNLGQLNHTLPPLNHNNRFYAEGGRERFPHAMSADIIMKNKVHSQAQQQLHSPQPPPQPPYHQLQQHNEKPSPSFNGHDERRIDPPLLTRETVPHAYRQLFSAIVDTGGLPRLYPSREAMAQQMMHTNNNRGDGQARFADTNRNNGFHNNPEQVSYGGGGGGPRQVPAQMQNAAPIGRTTYGGGQSAYAFSSQRPPIARRW